MTARAGGARPRSSLLTGKLAGAAARNTKSSAAAAISARSDMAVLSHCTTPATRRIVAVHTLHYFYTRTRKSHAGALNIRFARYTMRRRRDRLGRRYRGAIRTRTLMRRQLPNKHREPPNEHLSHLREKVEGKCRFWLSRRRPRASPEEHCRESSITRTRVAAGFR